MDYLPHGQSLCRRRNDGGSGGGVGNDFGNSGINGDNDRFRSYQKRIVYVVLIPLRNPKSESSRAQIPKPDLCMYVPVVRGAKPEDKENFNRSYVEGFMPLQGYLSRRKTRWEGSHR